MKSILINNSDLKINRCDFIDTPTSIEVRYDEDKTHQFVRDLFSNVAGTSIESPIPDCMEFIALNSDGVEIDFDDQLSDDFIRVYSGDSSGGFLPFIQIGMRSDDGDEVWVTGREDVFPFLVGVKDSDNLDDIQTFVAENYEDGEFSQAQSMSEVKSAGDTLFTYLMIELSRKEDCDSTETAVSRINRSIEQLQSLAYQFEINSDFRTIEENGAIAGKKSNKSMHRPG